MILRRIARPLLAAAFIADGIRAIKDPSGELELPGAKDQIESLAASVPHVPADALLLMRAVGAVKVGAGIALAVGVAPRAAATVLAALHVPSMALRHPVWAVPARERKTHLSGLLRDGAVLGGLLLAAADTEGKPSLAWRLDAAPKTATKTAKRLTASAKKDLARTIDRVEDTVEDTIDAVRSRAATLV